MSYIAVAGIVVSSGMSFLGSEQASKEAQKQREMMWNLKMTEIASNEKIAYEQIRTQNETERIKILAESLEKYREALQKESTIRLRDTWIYVAGLGAGTGVIYGLFLMYSKSSSNANA
jgi:nitric oxide reductase activation protein